VKRIIASDNVESQQTAEPARPKEIWIEFEAERWERFIKGENVPWNVFRLGRWPW
jgi:hypothetical protein